MSTQTSNAVNPIGPPTPPASAFDGRLITVNIDFPTGKSYSFDQNYQIMARGTKFTTATQSACELTIYNLTKELRNTIISRSSPWGNRQNLPKVSLSIGRVSYGTFLLYIGDVISANVTQPPDLGITLRALTNNALLGVIAATQQPANTQLSEIVSTVGDLLGATVDNQSTTKQINNFSSTGTPLDGVRKLNECGGIIAYCDNSTLVVLNQDTPKKNATRDLNASNGMVGIPQVTEAGMTVKMMADNTVQLGGAVNIFSVENPAANGVWQILKVDYEIASRDQAFFYVLTCKNLPYLSGAQ